MNKSFLIGNITVGGNAPFFLIAGPCQLETLDYARMIAQSLAEACAETRTNFVFKAIGPGLRDQCVSDQDILEFYEECDVIIVPSREESFGLAVIEALALGCVVITSEFVPSTYNLQHIDSLEIIKGDFVENTTSFLENSLTRDQLDANFDARQTLAQKIRGQFSENVVYSRYERSISEALE